MSFLSFIPLNLLSSFQSESSFLRTFSKRIDQPKRLLMVTFNMVNGMTFRLFYRGPLKSNGSKDNKHEIRLKFHPQLAKLWDQKRMKGPRGMYLTKTMTDYNKINVLYPVGDHDYACLITERLKVYAEIDILFLRPGEPGQIVTSGGDIDNRLKTLFDALRRPLGPQELPNGDLLDQTPNPRHCVLSDDSLISRVSVTTDTLLDAQNDDEVVLIITVTTMRGEPILGNWGYIP